MGAYEAKCETKYKDNCYEAYRDVQEPYVEDVCNDKDVAVCDKHWQCQNPNLPLENCNDKVWVDNQASCKYLKQTVCNQVEKYLPQKSLTNNVINNRGKIVKMCHTKFAI